MAESWDALYDTTPKIVQVNVNDEPIAAANPLPAQLSLANAVVAAANPLPAQLSLANAVVDAANPLPAQLSLANAVVDAANPLPTRQSPLPASLVAGMAAALGATTIGTPTANSNLRKLRVELTEDATLAVAGEDAISISLDGVTVFETQVYVPLTALATNGVLYHASETFSDIAFNTGASGTLVANLGTALATGALVVQGWFD